MQWDFVFFQRPSPYYIIMPYFDSNNSEGALMCYDRYPVLKYTELHPQPLPAAVYTTSMNAYI